MSPRVLVGVVCLVAGVMLAAWALAGFALIFVFVYLAIEAMSKAGRPKQGIRPAGKPAWSMKDEPPGGERNGDPR